MAKQKLIIEVRANEYQTRDKSPHVPYGPEEIAETALECWRAGASIVHFHATEPATGAPSIAVERYGEVVRRIREESDLITFPTLGADIIQSTGRVGHIVQLAKDPATRPDCVPIDMLTCNVDLYDVERKEFGSLDRVYSNTTGALIDICQQVRAVGVKPVPMLWNVAALRLTEAFLEMGVYEQPLLAELPVYADRFRGLGHPATIKGLYSLLDFFPPGADWHWLVSVIGCNAFPVLAGAIEAGGHVVIGVADYPYPELGFPTNAELVTRVVEMAKNMGREVATAAEVRELLDMH
ncbi:MULTISPECIES: 3-keto-5-aminohexanoate cleavage protein [unclassified Pseudofrankia]|uniref:3-keto-5-aminohexanoate cleavage protein n=1 Tax=unclassified Pseudofrankia TaxID=2994372 RepID=UPI0008DA6994|nr:MULTISPECIES: 3-keto-5-aminohexanoate cleavage protein [unclassified Pseudofrankia]MDT3442216.1 3-keto-5-aminohexanoate cleavage protein [Pseudofrankia sp. BMG5.37]OHV43571.1 hypothetical protein BCD48_27745 [Pseudofrankia sp. BMG5.36]